MRGTDLGALGVTLVIGGIGGLAAYLVHLPLGFLLGSMIVTAALAVTGVQPLGHQITLPAKLRFSFVPVIGVAIGGAFTPAVAGAILGWLPSLAALCLFVPLAHWMGYRIYRWGGLDPMTALYGAVPGGLIESVQMGEEAGADVRLLTLLQFLRLIMTILTVPLIFLGLTGHSVGSASGAEMVGAEAALSLWEVALMLVAGAVGAVVAKALRFPGYIITGPILFSAVFHGLGWMKAIPPAWLIAATQVVLGTGLGARFVGADRGMLVRAGRLAMVNGVAALTLAFAFAGLVHWLAGEPLAAAFLAFAPGGLAEMSLIALSLNMSVIYVTAHHVARIILAVWLAKFAGRWVRV